MKIKRIKINGISNPVGFTLTHLNLSYVLTKDASGDCELEFLIYADQNLQEEIYRQKLDMTLSYCTPIHFTPENERRYFFVIKDTAGQISDVCYFETGTSFDSFFITPNSVISNPVLFTEFCSPKNISSARLYVTGVGLYEAYINGQKVGNEYLTPYCDDYDNALQYQTYDVTEQIQENTKLEILLGDGWYKGRFGLKHKINIYGDTYAAAAKLIMKDKSGHTFTVTTDESWKARRSHIISSSIYDGEVIDDTLDTSEVFAVRRYDKKFNVIERLSLPVVCKREMKPQLIVSSKGEKILDFGQNMAAIIRFNSRLRIGQMVKLSVGEVLQQGCFYRENLRTAKAEFAYTSDGNEKTVKPHFTYYGFRYVLVEGIEKVDPEDFTAEVLYSDIEDTVQIHTDNDKINRLLENCKWGQRSNFVDVPTDCPQRDERLGWTGDAQVFSKAACFQADCKAFYDKYLFDLSVDQKLIGGGIPAYSPSIKESEVAAYSVWSDAATIIPWNVYQFYGDKTLLEKHFPMIEAYVNTLVAADDEHGGNRLYNFGFHLGDWLSQDGASPSALKGATDDYFIASMYYYNSVRIAAEAAQELGFVEKSVCFGKIYKEIYKALLNEYFSPNGRLTIDTQTAYTLCVNFGVYVNRERLIQDYKSRLKRDGFRLKGGFVGATQLIQSLIDCGLTEEAFSILYSENYPGWLYCVNLGATTIWERWNSINADGSISSTGMNSLNHYSYGAVAEAFYGYIAGVKALTPGFKTVKIEPVFNYRLKELDFAFASASGDYKVQYYVQVNNTVQLHVEVPYGCTATLNINQSVTFGEKMLSCGKYDFSVEIDASLNNPFSLDTPLCDALAHPDVSAALKELSPAFYYYFTTTDTGLNGEALSYVAHIDAFRISEEKLLVLDKRLREING